MTEGDLKMVSEFIKNRLDTAHGLIDEGRYDVAVELLKNIKLRIHEQETEDEITKFEKNHDSTLEMRIKEIKDGEEDQLRKDANELQEWALYAKAYLNFYDQISRKHGI